MATRFEVLVALCWLVACSGSGNKPAGGGTGGAEETGGSGGGTGGKSGTGGSTGGMVGAGGTGGSVAGTGGTVAQPDAAADSGAADAAGRPGQQARSHPRRPLHPHQHRLHEQRGDHQEVPLSG